MSRNRRYDKAGPVRKKQITRHAKSGKKDKVGLSEDVRVVHSDENNPHDG